jgi:hypothetical protein
MQGLAQCLALVIVLASALGLIAVAGLMALRPRLCLVLTERLLAHLEAGSRRANLTEQGLRILAGIALILRAPAARLPVLLETVGWLLVIPSILIVLAPVRWHAAYGRWWTERLTAPALRLLAPIPAAAGTGLFYMAL